MILGVLSDTHGHADTAAAAVNVLARAGAEAFVHCGDIGGEHVLAQLAGRRAWAVWGNCDDDSPLAARYATSLGVQIATEIPLRISLAGRSITVFHGHEALFYRVMQRATMGQAEPVVELLHGTDYVLSGHTHKRHCLRVGTVRFVNPGALHRAGIYSVATIDLAQDEVRFWRVDTDAESDAAPLTELPPPTGFA